MFSELIDSVVARSGRLDRRNDIVDYANATMREIQARAFFFKDGVEDTVAPASVDPTIWDYPGVFRKLKAVKYPDGSWVQNIQPGKGQGSIDGPTVNNYWYAAQTYITFVGVANAALDAVNNTTPIKLFYYTWFPRLKYYPIGLRPATYDEVLDTWTYYDLSTNTDADNNLNYNLNTANQTIALARVSNWMLKTWSEVLKEGTLNKLWVNVRDQERAVATYSIYNKGIESILMQEQQESVDG